MADFEINLNLLVDIIIKKKKCLEQILNITINQKELINTKDGKLLFIEMNREKQKLIDEVLSLDNVFKRKFDLISHNFESDIVNQTYRNKIKVMQDNTASILRLDSEIRNQERKNTEALEKNKANKKVNENKANELINTYKANNERS